MPYICCVTAYRTENFEKRIKKSSMDSMMVKPVFKGEIHDILIKSGINLSWAQSCLAVFILVTIMLLQDKKQGIN